MNFIKKKYNDIIVILSLFGIYLSFLLPLPFSELNDASKLFIPNIIAAKNLFLQGEIPFFNEYKFCTESFLADGTSNIINPSTLLYFFLDPVWAYTISCLALFFILLVGSWSYFRIKGFSITASTVATICYAFCGQVVSWSLYHGMNLSFAIFPWILYFFNKFELTRQNIFRILAFSAIFINGLSGFVQFAFFIGFLAIIEVMEDYSKNSFKKALSRFWVVLSGLGFASIMIIPQIEAILFSYRKIVPYYQILPSNFFNLLFSMLFGKNIHSDAFGLWTETPNHWFNIGIIFITLSIFALRKHFSSLIKKPLTLITLIPLIIIYSVFFKILPSSFQFGVQSDPTRTLFWTAFGLSVLSAIGCDSWIKFIKENKSFYIPMEIKIMSIFMLLIFIVFYSINANHQLAVILKIILLPLAVLFIEAIRLKKSEDIQLKTSIAKLLIIFTAFISFYIPASIYTSKFIIQVPNVNFLDPFKKEGDSVNLLPLKTISNIEGRVLFSDGWYPRENWSNVHKIRTIAGYSTLHHKNIFLRMKKDGLINKNYNAATYFTNNINTNPKILSKYGVQYFIAKEPANDYTKQGWNLYETQKTHKIYQNPYYVGRSYILDEKNNIVQKTEIIQNTNSHIKIKALNVKSGQTLILSDSWFPGWECYDNGKKVNGFDAEGFRGYKFNSSGTHIIEWSYQPNSFILGGIMSIFSLITFLILMRLL
jgi:hypothetical protein